MPFTIKKRGNKFIVTKEGESRVLGTHATRKAAVAQIGAIESSLKRRGKR